MSHGFAPSNPSTGLGPDPAAMEVALNDFHSVGYLRHNARRLEHLNSLGLDISGRSVLELGAGIGDHTHARAPSRRL